MVLMHSVPWMEPGSGGEDDVEWHMWKTRQWPYQDLEDGLSYFSVTGGGPQFGRVMSECRMEHLVKAPYANHEEAWGLLRTGLPAAERARLGLRDKNQFLRNVHPRGPAKWTPSRFRCTPCPRC
jgi:hypothetical protein